MSLTRNSRLTLQEKIEIINECSEITQSDVAKNHKISKQAVSYILNNADIYLNAIDQPLQSKQVRGASNLIVVEEKIIDFINICNLKQVPLSYALIREKALEIVKEEDIQNFSCSFGWIKKFMEKYSIKKKNICGESNSVDHRIVFSWKQQLADYLTKMPECTIMNADETSCFFKQVKRCSYFVNNNDSHGCSTSKERFTAMLCVTQSGIKLKPLIIGKSKHPRCFKNKDLSSLNVHYYHNTNAWMTSSISSSWLTKINNYFESINEKIILILDNFSGHKTGVEYSNITIIFLPSNTTSETQPLDRGIISIVKRKQKEIINKQIIKNLENISNVADYTKSINLYDGIETFVTAFDQVTKSTIVNCFRHCGVVVTDSQPEKIKDYVV